MSNELPERVAKLEAKVDNHDRLLQTQQERNDLLTKISLIIENQREDAIEREKRQDLRDEKQNQRMEHFSFTMEKVNENLSNLNSTQQQIREDLSEVVVRVEKVEKFQHDDKEKNTIDLNGVLKKFIIWAIGIGLTALAFYFYILLGVR